MIPLIDELLAAKEGEAKLGRNLEFKKAENSFEFDELAKYTCAIANNGGGYVVLGVSDKRPRTVTGTAAFEQPERTREGLINKLGLNIDFSIQSKDEKRVLIFHAPNRPVGTPIKFKGIYWSLKADSLVPMGEDQLRGIFAESGHDFSSDICPAAQWSDLDPKAIEEFRRLWISKTKNRSFETLSQEQLLKDCEAVIQDRITYAALILFGTRTALGRLLGQAEVVFEYRSSEASGPAQHREEFRQGFFSFYNRLWELINLRNDKLGYQEGLIISDVMAFDERSVREAILNAVSHRDYQLGGCVFIRQYPRKLVIESPGGLPVGITLENILDRQSPRNRRIADIFSKCGLVERSGQGMNLIYEMSIRNAKSLPDMRGTDQYHVALALDGNIQDINLLKMMEKIGQEKLAGFSTQDFLLVNLIHLEKGVPEALKDRLPRLMDLGIIEKVARGKFILGRRYYTMTGQRGIYTRKKGLDRERNKELLLKHIQDNGREGAHLSELYDVLPGLERSQIQVLLRELRREHKIHCHGRSRAGKWFSISTEDCAYCQESG